MFSNDLKVITFQAMLYNVHISIQERKRYISRMSWFNMSRAPLYPMRAVAISISQSITGN